MPGPSRFGTRSSTARVSRAPPTQLSLGHGRQRRRRDRCRDAGGPGDRRAHERRKRWSGAGRRLRATADLQGNFILQQPTDRSGAYDLEQLPPGQYKLKFVDDGCTGREGTYAPQYFDAEATLAQADPVTVTAGQTMSAIDARMEPSGSAGGAGGGSGGGGGGGGAGGGTNTQPESRHRSTARAVRLTAQPDSARRPERRTQAHPPLRRELQLPCAGRDQGEDRQHGSGEATAATR